MSGAGPAWLAEDPEIRGLLSAALDRFDRLRGSERQRPISLAAEEFLPSLAHADAAADHTWALVRELQRLGTLSIHGRRGNSFDPEWVGAKLRFPPEIEGRLREWLGRAWIEPAMQAWRRAVAGQAHAFNDGGAALLSQRIAVAGHGAEEVVAALASVHRLSGPVTLRQLSATLFWGDSKVLDDRAALIAAIAPRLEIRERAVVVSIHMPRIPQGVLFIENQDTYTAAAEGAIAGVGDTVLVYAAGFRGAAARIRTRGGSMLHYAGVAMPQNIEGFDAWWFGEGAAPGPCWFWGDLDFAGMQILKSLRLLFGDLCAWRPGYDPMLAAIAVEGGYGGSLPDTRGQIDPGTTGCAYADTVLLPAIREYGHSDQERLKFRRPESLNT